MAPQTLLTEPEPAIRTLSAPDARQKKDASSRTKVVLATLPAIPRSARGAAPAAEPSVFAEALLENADLKQPRRVYSVVLSSLLQVLLLTTVLLMPLIYTQQIDFQMFSRTMLAAPPPPPPPPPPPMLVKGTAAPIRRVTMLQAGRLVAPMAIPTRVLMVKEAPLPPEPSSGYGVVGGVPGGVPGGQEGGVMGGILAGMPSTVAEAPPPPPAASQVPIRVGGRVKPPRGIFMPKPVYPDLARQARIQGDVVIDAVIDANGNVVQMRVISGHPLLIGAALDAVRQWRYQPTYLNDVAVPLAMTVTVSFTLE